MMIDLDKFSPEELKDFYYDLLEELRIHLEGVWSELDHGGRSDESLEMIFSRMSEIQLRIQDLFSLGVTIRLQEASNEVKKGT